jgi:NADH/F420H2 dehydrogenase subunit C
LTKTLAGSKVAEIIAEVLPDAIVKYDANNVWVNPSYLDEACKILKHHANLDFSYLNSITAVDYIEKFELLYHLTSLRTNSKTTIRVTCPNGRKSPSVPSVISIWQSADLQEREIWDLMGIKFIGHPNLKRILLWEGFDGHPLRKDYLG